ncbi:MAG: transketolase [Candidatus Eremiobacteraeota bacterium]|nr:transketolase [Candidatus Eremiobacteraeota bacterium]
MILLTAVKTEMDQLCINTIRFLSVDGVQRANSGHPGAPLGMATMAYTLWDRFLKHNPWNSRWQDRDRFVLSAGHASILLYSMLHLTGYDLSLEEIKNFRQWGSKTPGHPEYDLETGIETTTGPLGQGFANAIGMAIAEKWLSANFNRPGFDIIDHFTYVIASDGDLMEGVSGEAASMAGNLGLGKLICLYDDNGISIEGKTQITFTENVAKRFSAYDWQVIGPIDGFNTDEIEKAIKEAREDSERPSLIMCKTIIGYGSPKQGTEKVHGSPLGKEGVRAAKEKLGWIQEPDFHIPCEVLNYIRKAVERGKKAEEAWKEKMEKYAREYPEQAEKLQKQLSGELPDNWDEGLSSLFNNDSPPMATRSASGKVLNMLAGRIPSLMGGSADLAPSNKTLINDSDDFSNENPAGRNLRYGVREHAMGAISNGLALHGGVIPYTGTFLIFSDYMRPPIRLAAMMGLRVIYIFTHDSIGLGEDGPTHQPVEQLMSLRTVPNLTVIRPADATETAQAWKAAVGNNEGPTALILTRQNLPVIDREKYAKAQGLQKGAYVLWQSSENPPETIIIGTGSELEIALEAGHKLAEEGMKVRVVSMPSWELFDKQPEEYRESVLPSDVRARVAVEAGIKTGWEHYVGLDGSVVGMESFGASAPIKVLYKKFGITVEDVMARVESM